ncbi:uncharacterized protein si:ch73-109i22.2 isoform X2 [Esox lucius]|uniref:SH2 domain-containing protein n=1 Tax=Esox lucius TaxID=8010 RepID=A0A3P8YA11_ESOLU|nr:uncharacterized protein si:ch73-109i22.2 isoform X2 [Esox lucius]
MNMDFDYQHLKDVEKHKREERIRGLQSAQDTAVRQIPPVRPRRSLKVPKTHQEEVAIPAKQTNSELPQIVVKKMSPALTLGGPGPLEPLSPSLRAHTLLWFERTQLPRLCWPGHALPRWLHGFATRREAEELLKDKHQGCFLLRLSESKIGFVLSYRGQDRCRHFIIEEEASSRGVCYLISGEESRHGSLPELVNYYTQNPVGPYNEMLTTPCDKSRQAYVDTVEHDLQGEGGKITENEASVLSSTATCTPDTVQMPEVSASSASNDDRMPDYAAVVKKKLQKSNSLPENQFGKLNEVRVLVHPPEDDATKCNVSCEGAGGRGDDHHEATYARVNKPPRVLSQVDRSPYVNVNPPGQQGAMPSSSVPATHHGSAVDPGYWKLEPLHTYEETFQPARSEEEVMEHIDFNAMGQWRDADSKDNVEGPRNHLYSEVNIRGAKQGPSHTPLPTRMAPSLPSRPPPRAINCPARPERSVQQSGEPLLSFSPSQHGVFQLPCSERHLTDKEGTRIYEQIQDKSRSSRPPLPPLPPPNAKH